MFHSKITPTQDFSEMEKFNKTLHEINRVVQNLKRKRRQLRIGMSSFFASLNTQELGEMPASWYEPPADEYEEGDNNALDSYNIFEKESEEEDGEHSA